MRYAFAARAACFRDPLHLAFDQQVVLRGKQVHVSLQRQEPLLGRPAFEVEQARCEGFSVQTFARLERQLRLGMHAIREWIVLALVIIQVGWRSSKYAEVTWAVAGKMRSYMT